jgi:TonB family protein
MKKLLLLFLTSLFATAAFFAQSPINELEIEPPPLPLPQAPVIEEPEEIFKVVERIPEFPDGEEAMLKFFYDNIRYPAYAKAHDIQGKVRVKFVIEKDGSVNDAAIVEDIGGGCGAEALRVVHKMPKWNPGSPRGRPTRVQYILPIEFILKNKKPIRPTQMPMEKVEILAKSYSSLPGKDEVFDYVEYPPMFMGCDTIQIYTSKQKCNETELSQFIANNLKYPRKARRQKIEGTIYVSFIIEKDGTVSSAKLMSDIGEGCGEEALRVVNAMPKWTPGKQRGQFIRYRYELPIVFSLKKK